MARVKRGVTSHAKHKKTLDAAKGFYGRRKNTIRTAKAAVEKAAQYALHGPEGKAGRRHLFQDDRVLGLYRVEEEAHILT